MGIYNIFRCFAGQSLLASSAAVFLSTVSLLGFIATATSGIVINSIFMSLAGMFNCGPDCILGELFCITFYCT